MALLDDDDYDNVLAHLANRDRARANVTSDAFRARVLAARGRARIEQMIRRRLVMRPLLSSPSPACVDDWDIGMVEAAGLRPDPRGLRPSLAFVPFDAGGHPEFEIPCTSVFFDAEADDRIVYEVVRMFLYESPELEDGFAGPVDWPIHPARLLPSCGAPDRWGFRVPVPKFLVDGHYARGGLEPVPGRLVNAAGAVLLVMSL